MRITIGASRVRDFGARFVLESRMCATNGGTFGRWRVVSFPSTLEFALASLGETELRRRAQDCASLDSLLVEVRAVRDEIVALGAM